MVNELFAKFAFVMPALPLKFALVKPVIVLSAAEITLFVNVSFPAVVASIPVVGKVTSVSPGCR
jgi:hypothetical protein